MPSTCTVVSLFSNPGWNSGRFGVRAARDARWPPALPPQMTMVFGSPPYAEMFSLTQLMARLTSTMWSGHTAPVPLILLRLHDSGMHDGGTIIYYYLL